MFRGLSIFLPRLASRVAVAARADARDVISIHLPIFYCVFSPRRSPARPQRGLLPRLRPALSDGPPQHRRPPLACQLAAWAGQARPVASRACSGPATGCSPPALRGPRSSSRQKGHKSGAKSATALRRSRRRSPTGTALSGDDSGAARSTLACNCAEAVRWTYLPYARRR